MNSIHSAESSSIPSKPILTVIGVGGAGGNAVNNMIISNLQEVNFIVANTDAQALEHSLAPKKIQLGPKVTKGLGAGASPEVAAQAAEESRDEIKDMLAGSNMLFITAGMGGGTGTGAAPVIAAIAQEMGILTIGVVTKPFSFEGAHRMRTAQSGLSELRKYVDTLIIIPNQNLFRIANENTTFVEAFKMADEVLHAGVRGVTDLINMPGLVNLDFADIKTVMQAKGEAMMGTGEVLITDQDDEDRDIALQAAEAAISNPLLDHCSIEGAQAVLINITGGSRMTLSQVDRIANRIRQEIGNQDNDNILFGSTFDSNFNGIRVSVIATGIERAKTSTTPQYNQKPTSTTKTHNLPNTSSYTNIIEEHSIEKFDKYNLSETRSINNLPERVQTLIKVDDANKLAKAQNVNSTDDYNAENKYEIPAYLRRKK